LNTTAALTKNLSTKHLKITLKLTRKTKRSKSKRKKIMMLMRKREKREKKLEKPMSKEKGNIQLMRSSHLKLIKNNTLFV